MTKYFFLPVLVVVVFSRIAFAADVLIDKEAGGIRFVAMTSDAPIDIGALQKLHNSQNAAAVFSVTELFRSKEIAFRLLGGKGATDLDNHAVWLHRYLADASKVAPDIGEVVQVGKDVIIRSFRDGKYAESLVSGRNPLVCGGTKEECEIIWISIGRIPPHQEGLFDRPRVHLFVKTSVLPDVSRAKRLAVSLQERFATKLLSVSFRTDEWFVDDTDFPVIYPFEVAAKPDDLNSVDANKEVLCVSDGTNMRCR